MRKIAFPTLSFAAVALLPTLAHAAGDTGATDVLADGMLWAFLAAFGWGFMTSLTPCVYPMVPLIVAVFGARDEAITRRKAVMLATLFVLGICTLYTALGVGFAMLGKSSNELLANPWVIVPVAAVLLALAASMFGAFELRLPHSLQQQLNKVGGKGYGGAFALGLVLGIIAAPCTGAFAAGIIAYIASTQDVPVGALLMFTYAVGMGVLFWVLAVFAVSLPKSGHWMENVKNAGGIVLIVMAAYFLIPIAPVLGELADPSVKFLAASVLVAVIGVAIGAVHLSFHGGATEKLRKGIGVLLVFAGLFGALTWYLTPDNQIEWRHDEAAAYAEARETGKHVMVDFGATWCVPCKEIEKIVGDDSLYADITGSFVPLKIDVSDQDEEDQRLQEKYGAPVLPAVIFLDGDGNELGRYTNKNPDIASFRKTLRDVGEKRPL
jgi:thiol:disulfide interchange protein DsbD